MSPRATSTQSVLLPNPRRPWPHALVNHTHSLVALGMLIREGRGRGARGGGRVLVASRPSLAQSNNSPRSFFHASLSHAKTLLTPHHYHTHAPQHSIMESVKAAATFATSNLIRPVRSVQEGDADRGGGKTRGGERRELECWHASEACSGVRGVCLDHRLRADWER